MKFQWLPSNGNDEQAALSTVEDSCTNCLYWCGLFWVGGTRFAVSQFAVSRFAVPHFTIRLYSLTRLCRIAVLPTATREHRYSDLLYEILQSFCFMSLFTLICPSCVK